jgi:hypothetical protein
MSPESGAHHRWSCPTVWKSRPVVVTSLRAWCTDASASPCIENRHNMICTSPFISEWHTHWVIPHQPSRWLVCYLTASAEVCMQTSQRCVQHH